MTVRTDPSAQTTTWNVDNYALTLPYYVTAPRQNYAQGEVVQSSKTWLAGGSTPEPFQAYWQDANGTYQWGYHQDCVNPPYYLNKLGASTWNNGGHG